MTTGILIAIFVSLYTAHLVLDFVLSRLNLQHALQYREPPGPFAGHISLEQHQKALAYHKAYYGFDMVETIFHAIVFLVFIYAGWLNTLDAWLYGYIGHEIHRGVVFFAMLAVFSWILGLPFSWHSTFVIEEKFGFNRQTVKLWIMDHIKSLGLTCVLLVPVAYLLLYFMKTTGAFWWIYCWGLMFAYSLLITMIYPVLIAPIFNKFTPLPAGELRTGIENLAAATHFPLANIYVMDASTRSKHSNAYFAGFGKTKRLVLYDSLIQDFGTDEILTVVAHEIGHFQHKHIIKQMFIGQLLYLGFFYVLSLGMSHPDYVYPTFCIDPLRISSYMSLILLGFWISLLLPLLSPFFNLLSWRFETQADRASLEMTQKPEALKTMLIKLADKNLSNLTPHPWYARFHYSHPPIWQRLQNLGLA